MSPTHGEQEHGVWNGHYDCTCYHPLFVFNQYGDLERCALRPGNVHSADGWEAGPGKAWKGSASRRASSAIQSMIFLTPTQSPLRCRGQARNIKIPEHELFLRDRHGWLSAFGPTPHAT